MDYVYVCLGVIVFICSCYAQFIIVKVNIKYSCILPLIYAILTFFIGFLSLLIGFVLIFIGQLTNAYKSEHQHTEVFHNFDHYK